MPPAESGSSSVPWWVTVAGVITVLIVTFGKPLAEKWFGKAHEAKPETDLNSAPANTDVVQKVTSKGFSAEDVIELLGNARQAKLKAEELAARVATLEMHDQQKDWLVVQSIQWGINAPGEPPRTPPEFLRLFLRGLETDEPRQPGV